MRNQAGEVVSYVQSGDNHLKKPVLTSAGHQVKKKKSGEQENGQQASGIEDSGARQRAAGRSEYHEQRKRASTEVHVKLERQREIHCKKWRRRGEENEENDDKLHVNDNPPPSPNSEPDRAWKVIGRGPLGAEESPGVEPSTNQQDPALESLPHPTYESKLVEHTLEKQSRPPVPTPKLELVEIAPHSTTNTEPHPQTSEGGYRELVREQTQSSDSKEGKKTTSHEGVDVSEVEAPRSKHSLHGVSPASNPDHSAHDTHDTTLNTHSRGGLLNSLQTAVLSEVRTKIEAQELTQEEKGVQGSTQEHEQSLDGGREKPPTLVTPLYSRIPPAMPNVSGDQMATGQDGDRELGVVATQAPASKASLASALGSSMSLLVGRGSGEAHREPHSRAKSDSLKDEEKQLEAAFAWNLRHLGATLLHVRQSNHRRAMREWIAQARREIQTQHERERTHNTVKVRSKEQKRLARLQRREGRRAELARKEAEANYIEEQKAWTEICAMADSNTAAERERQEQQRRREREAKAQIKQQRREEEAVNALRGQRRRRFHAVHVKIKFDHAKEGSEEEATAIADTGAGMNICPDGLLDVEVIKENLRPGKARAMQSASTHDISSRGEAKLSFRLGALDHKFEAKWQIVNEGQAPLILGNEFWDEHEAEFNFRRRVIVLHVEGTDGNRGTMEIPFTIGDEQKADTEKPMAIYSIEDKVIPPGQSYEVLTIPQGDDQILSHEEVWMVTGPDEDEDEDETSHGEESRSKGEAKPSRKANRKRALRDRRNTHTWRRTADEKETTVATTMADGIIHPSWHSSTGQPCLKIRGMNHSSDLLIVRKGERVGEALKWNKETICEVAEKMEQFDEAIEAHAGTTSKFMQHRTEHTEDDWRTGLSVTQIIEKTKEADVNMEYEKWRSRLQKELKIGDEGNPLNEEIQDLYARLIFAYKDVLADNSKKPGIIPGIYHEIIFEEGAKGPVRDPVRMGSQKEEAIKNEEIRTLIKNEIVEPCNSPYSSNVVMVKKKDGTLRTCIDFRKLNNLTKFDAFPLTRIDEALDALGNAKVLSSMDCTQAFWSILMHPHDADKTAFGTREFGQLRFTRMPFGLRNSTATYGRALQHVLRGLLWQKCIMYVDDNISWGDSHDDHLCNLHQVLKRFSIHNVSVKLEKCRFACSETEYVGHVVKAGRGVAVDPKKVSDLLKLGKPKTVAELKSFLGAASYFKRFVKDFAHLAMPLRKIEHVYKSKQMNIEHLWGPNQTKSFNALKAALAAAPVLTFPDWSKPFVVLSDCSDYAKGATLAQEVDGVERPIAYISQALNDHEKKYGITDKEGCAAVWAVRKWRHMLHGNQVILVTDHAALASLTSGRPLKSMRQQRYAMDLSEFCITIRHRAGAKLHLPDALSRLGYSPDRLESMVSTIKSMVAEECSVEALTTAFIADNATRLQCQVQVADVGQDETMAELQSRLRSDEVKASLVPETGCDEARVVERYDDVMVVTRRQR